jgi:thioredoxin-related protein
MKTVFCSFLISLACLGQLQAQTTITLIVQPGAQTVTAVDAFDLSQKAIHSVAYRDTLRFEFAKTNIDGYNFRYHVNGKVLRQQIWLDSGHIQIRAHLTDRELVIDTVLNSPMYYTARFFFKNAQGLADDKDITMLNSYLTSMFFQHSNNPFSLVVAHFFVQQNTNNPAQLLAFKPSFDALGNKFDWFLLYPSLAKRFANLPEGQIKIDLTKYAFLDQAKQAVKLSLTGAKYYVLDYWFLACAPCVADHREIKKQQELLKQHEVEMIGVSIDYTEPEKWQAYLKKHQYDWPNYLQTKYEGLMNDLSFTSFPTYIVLNPQGEVLGIYHAFFQVKERLKLNN